MAAENSYHWEEKYNDAILETDNAKLLKRITTAKATIAEAGSLNHFIRSNRLRPDACLNDVRCTQMGCEQVRTRNACDYAPR